MSRKIAIKRLKPSDLSFFQSYLLRNPGKSKQKGFNIDAAILASAFYPSLAAIIQLRPKKAIHIDLVLAGPGIAGTHTLARKIKREAKNYRLNGEVIHDPEGEVGRYDALCPEDFAVIEFGGMTEPSAAKIVLVAASEPADTKLHGELALLFSAGSMRLLTEDEIAGAIERSSPPQAHPIRDWLDQGLIEDVGFIQGSAAEKLNRTRNGRGLSPAELRDAKLAAEQVGNLGELLLDHYLSNGKWVEVATHEWTAAENAISPFDFRLFGVDGSVRYADAKSTAGSFDNTIHMSIGEIRWAMHLDTEYDLIRLYQVTEKSAKFRVASNIRNQLISLSTMLANLPKGSSVDSISFSPDFFSFAEEFTIEVDEVPD